MSAAGALALANLVLVDHALAGPQELEVALDGAPAWWGTIFDEGPTAEGDHYKAIVGDFDGDGQDDIARVFGVGPETSIDVFLADDDRFVPGRWADQMGGFWKSQRYFAGDTNGDGRDDIIRVFDHSGAVSIDVLISTGGAFTYQRWLTASGVYDPAAEFLVGDFDGDGREELAHVFGDVGYTTSIDVLLSDGAAFTPARWLTQVNQYLGRPWAAADFDGDGDSDVAVVYPEGDSKNTVDIYRSQQGSFSVERWATMVGPYKDLPVRAGDFDGDGVADLVVLGSDEARAEVLLGGEGTFTYHPLMWSDDVLDYLLPGDFDGDGKTELAITSRRPGRLTARVFGAPSTLDHTAEPIRWAGGQGGFWDEQRYFSGDFNGDGAPDVARVFGHAGQTTIDVHLNSGAGFYYNRWITEAGGHWAGQSFARGDFDGDGHDDIIKIWGNAGLTSLDVYRGGDDGFTLEFWTHQDGGHWDSQRFVAGDFDGDGRSDVAKLWGWNGKIIVDVYRSNGGGFEPFEYWSMDAGPDVPGASYFAGDFDGDGRDDVARLYRDPTLNEGAIYSGAVYFSGAGASTMLIDYTSVDVLRSTGDAFVSERWADKTALVDAGHHTVVGDFDRDGRDDMVMVAPNREGKVGMLLYRSTDAGFDTEVLLEDDQIEYSRSMKVVAADFDLDAQAEVATIYGAVGSGLANFDVWGGETALDPSLVGAPGDTRLYTPQELSARVAGMGKTLVATTDLQANQCTIVYPHGLEEVQARDLGLLLCAEDAYGHRISAAAVYGGCDFAGGAQSCSIGVIAKEVTILGYPFDVRGPHLSGCASVSREMVCASVKKGMWEKSFTLSSDLIAARVGVYLGPVAGASAGFENSVLSAKVGAGPFSVQYSVDLADTVSLGSAGFKYIAEGFSPSVAGSAVNYTLQGLDKAFGTISNLASTVGDKLKKVFCFGLC